MLKNSFSQSRISIQRSFELETFSFYPNSLDSRDKGLITLSPIFFTQYYFVFPDSADFNSAAALEAATTMNIVYGVIVALLLASVFLVVLLITYCYYKNNPQGRKRRSQKTSKLGTYCPPERFVQYYTATSVEQDWEIKINITAVLSYGIC